MERTFRNRIRDFLILLSPVPSSTRGHGRILIFHDIQDKTAFKKRMEWLKMNYSIVSLDELLQNKPSGNNIAITFDDGYHCWYANVFPVLKELNMPATFFVNSGLVSLQGGKMDLFFQQNCRRAEKELRAISEEELIEISQNNLFTIGGHSTDHVDFSKNLNESTLDQQIKQDKQFIEKLIQQKIHYFAYPFGQLHNAPLNVQKKVEQAGYKAAFTIIPGFAEVSKSLFLINRDSLELHQSERVWGKWLNGAYDVWVNRKLSLYHFLGIRFR